jgi:hypothetical protein
MKRLILLLGVTVLTLLPLAAGADSAQQFQPSYNITSFSPSTPGAHGTVAQHIGVAQTDHVIGSLKFTLPVGWDIAEIQSSNDEPVVGTGILLADVGPPAYPSCDGIMETYPLTIVDQGPDTGIPDAETIWVAQGYLQQFQFPVKNAGGSQTLEGMMFNAGPQVCAMTTLDLTFQGVSSDNPITPEGEAGRNVLTNPSISSVYTWSVEFKSFPVGSPSVHIVTRCDRVGVSATATDTDSDGIADGCDNCLMTANADQRNFDNDAFGDVCDSDVDGDTVANGSDQCAFTPLGQPHDTIGCSQSQVDQDLDGKCDPGFSSPSWCTGTDNCPTTANPTQANVVHPATTPGDACEDPDGDFWADYQDNCPDNYNPFQEDGDLDGLGDLCDIVGCSMDPDCDNDNVSDGRLDPDSGGPIVAGPDNCPLIPNTNQLNQDADSLGNACDNCPTVTNGDQINIDGDSFGDACDAGDFDLDGFSDRVEYAAGTDRGAKCPSGPSHNAWPADTNNNSFSDTGDIGFLTGYFALSVPPAPARANIAPDPPVLPAFVDTADLGRMTAVFGLHC